MRGICWMHGWYLRAKKQNLLGAGETGEIRTIAAARPGLLNKCPCVWLWRAAGCAALPQRFPAAGALGLSSRSQSSKKLQRLGWEWECCSSRMQLLLLTTDVIRRGYGRFLLVLTVPDNVRVGIHSKPLNNKFRTAQRKKGVWVCVHFRWQWTSWTGLRVVRALFLCFCSLRNDHTCSFPLRGRRVLGSAQGWRLGRKGCAWG